MMALVLLIFFPIAAGTGILWLLVFIGEAIVGAIRDYVQP